MRTVDEAIQIEKKVRSLEEDLQRGSEYESVREIHRERERDRQIKQLWCKQKIKSGQGQVQVAVRTLAITG